MLYFELHNKMLQNKMPEEILTFIPNGLTSSYFSKQEVKKIKEQTDVAVING